VRLVLRARVVQVSGERLAVAAYPLHKTSVHAHRHKYKNGDIEINSNEDH
jgi:hypothetical protein